MSTVFVTDGKQAVMVYDDRWRVIAEALGPISVKRATEVEFDHKSGEWTATLLDSGVVIARGKNRQEVIQQEVQHLERKLKP